MIWEELKNGICFDELKTPIKWGMSLNEIRKVGNPSVNENNGQIEVAWNNYTLFGDLKGDWRASFLPTEFSKSFKQIGQRFTGDKESIEAYNFFEKYFTEKLGKPVVANETSLGEKELEWRNGEYSINLYLFEMHSFRLNFNIVKK